MRRLLALFGLIPSEGRVNPELAKARVRSQVVLGKANAALVEERRVEQMRASFKRADDRVFR